MAAVVVDSLSCQRLVMNGAPRFHIDPIRFSILDPLDPSDDRLVAVQYFFFSSPFSRHNRIQNIQLLVTYIGVGAVIPQTKGIYALRADLDSRARWYHTGLPCRREHVIPTLPLAMKVQPLFGQPVCFWLLSKIAKRRHPPPPRNEASARNHYLGDLEMDQPGSRSKSSTG